MEAKLAMHMHINTSHTRRAKRRQPFLQLQHPAARFKTPCVSPSSFPFPLAQSRYLPTPIRQLTPQHRTRIRPSHCQINSLPLSQIPNPNPSIFSPFLFSHNVPQIAPIIPHGLVRQLVNIQIQVPIRPDRRAVGPNNTWVADERLGLKAVVVIMR
jgi:hypothetical protein